MRVSLSCRPWSVHLPNCLSVQEADTCAVSFCSTCTIDSRQYFHSCNNIQHHYCIAIYFQPYIVIFNLVYVTTTAVTTASAVTYSPARTRSCRSLPAPSIASASMYVRMCPEEKPLK